MKPTKAVLITGGSKGIGEGCARSFAKEGWNVLICARDKKTGETTASKITRLGGGTCEFLACDVTDIASVEKTAAAAAARWKRLDCLVNNVGWHPPAGTIDDFSVEDFRRLVQLNLVSCFAFSKYALPHLRKVKGSIVNIGSLVTQMGQPNAPIYVAAKSGMDGLTKALAIDEAKHGVRVNEICPAGVDTPLMREWAHSYGNYQEAMSLVDRWHHLGRMATIEEIGNVACFLASEKASFVTGVILPVSGGAELGYASKGPKSHRRKGKEGGTDDR